ncbi:MAG: hypothetical protein AB7E29_01545 [Xanthobacter sp.]
MWPSTSAVALFLILAAVTDSYRRVEHIATAVGLFELVFFVTMVMSSPDPDQIR